MYLAGDFFPVVEKFLESFVGEWMRDEFVEHGKGYGGDVGADECGFQDVERMPNAGDDNLGGELIIGEDGFNIAHDVHANVADIVEATDERAYVGSARFRGEQCLQRIETEGDVRLDALALQHPGGN